MLVEPVTDSAEDPGDLVLSRLEKIIEITRNAGEEVDDRGWRQSQPIDQCLPLLLNPLTGRTEETADRIRDSREEVDDRSRRKT